MDLDDIELYYNLDFDPEIRKNYENIILDIFNNMCPDTYYNINININNPTDIDTEIIIIVALYYISINNYNIAINILKDINNNKAYCTLGILYNILNDKESSIYYFKLGANDNHILSITNLAFEYLCQGDFDNFLLFNKISLDKMDENAMINQGIYYWNILKDYYSADNIFNCLLNNNNYRAYYEYAKLIQNVNKKKELLIKAIQLKPKKTYIEMLIKITGDYERGLLYKQNNININKIMKIDYMIKLENDNTRYNICPTCIVNEKKELFILKCNHSFCNNCIIKYCKNKCSVCYK